MSSLDLIRMGIKNLWRRKLRTFLTILGVIIGTSSIVVMLSLGFGMQEAFKGQLARMGSLNTINVYKRDSFDFRGTDSNRNKKEGKLDDKAIANFKNIPHVTAVTPIIETYGTLKCGKYTAYTSIKGIDPEAMAYFDFKTAEGRLLQPGDNLHVVFGGGMKYNFYDEKAMSRGRYKQPEIDLMNDRMVLTFDTDSGYISFPDGNSNRTKNKEYNIKAVGVLEEGNFETDWGIYLPIETVKKLVKEKEKVENNAKQGKKAKQEYERIMIRVDDIKYVEEIQGKIKNEGYEAYSLNDMLEELNKITGIIQAVLGGIGAVSLLVAAIGITNTMVMSIYERTKEIGIMKVIGASLKDIKKLFLFESAIIGLLGGAMGIIFSFLLSFIVNRFSMQFSNFLGLMEETNISIIPIWLIFAALGFSTLIGLISGYYPARRAMNLSALEAIRTE
ncbi:ABC transporter permease [Tepidimicrobium xylanilyticum]|uniref:ABC-type transport system, involved in lipoprotein release, permease component n=1 Tax=Tepidimicrobium xylanilyticum TaxID=1123352 RepID=A0A1H2R6E8_9FIRM|nr:ABC transporter permease [Tepidimicrobium xylanilyticum]SDW14895.1 ABC-type transport system, involved in lipoprotein release, permease component [Tepidimicrobium xylanilyticum]